MLTTSNCCCCFSLRTGTLIIGWVSLVAAVLSFSSLYTSGGQLVVSGVLQVLVAIGLLYGVYKPYKPFVFWYAAIQAIVIVIQIALVIYFLVVAGENGADFGGIVGAIIIFIIIWLIQIYFIVVVYSYYKEMESYA